MNASYKIVLLGAFVLFAAVVGYYVLSGDGQAPAEEAPADEIAQREVDTPPAPPRQTLDNPPPFVPVAPPEPEIEQIIIGPTLDDTPAPPRIDPILDPIRPAPRTGDPTETTTEPPSPTDPIRPDPLTDEASPTNEPRPGPGPDVTSPVDEEATDPTPEPEPEPEPRVEPEPSPRPIPPDPQTVPRNYTVAAGDTFASIATRFYGEEAAWFEIAQANPSVDPKRLQVGQIIVLPNRDTIVREREEVQPPAPGKDQSYAVRPGDNLSKIAQRFYGDSEKWDLIYARNRQLIGPRPDALKVGMELVIPQAYDGAD